MARQTPPGIEQYAIRAFADALDDIPMALAENAGLQPIVEVSNIKSRQLAEGNPRLGTLSFFIFLVVLFWLYFYLYSSYLAVPSICIASQIATELYIHTV